MIDLVLLGVSHRTAPVAVREKLAVTPDALEETLKALAGSESVREAVLVSTCNRIEIYGAARRGDGSAAAALLRRHMTRRAALGEPELAPHLYERQGRDAVHHLFRVASSLDSMVVGEPQILGQVKEAYEAAVRAGVAGPVLGLCFSRAFRVARKVRRDTAIARSPTSVSSVAVDLARQVFDGFAHRRVLVVGAGKMADLAARAFQSQGAALTVTNWTAARAEELAARIGCGVHPWEDLAGAFERSDIVLASTGAREPVITQSFLAGVQKQRRGRPLFLVDIAVPRDVEPACATLGGVFLADIDNLQAVAASHLDRRRGEADRAEALVEEEVRQFVESVRGRSVAPTINALRALFLGAAREEGEKVLAALPGLGERERRLVADAFERMAKKLLHGPQVAIKKGAATDGAPLADAACSLFDLSPVVLEAGGDEGEARAESEPAVEDGKKAAP